MSVNQEAGSGTGRSLASAVVGAMAPVTQAENAGRGAKGGRGGGRVGSLSPACLRQVRAEKSCFFKHWCNHGCLGHSVLTHVTAQESGSCLLRSAVITAPGGPPPASPESMWGSPGPGKGEQLSGKTSRFLGPCSSQAPSPGHPGEGPGGIPNTPGSYLPAQLGKERTGEQNSKGGRTGQEQPEEPGGSGCAGGSTLREEIGAARAGSEPPRRFMFCKLCIQPE